MMDISTKYEKMREALRNELIFLSTVDSIYDEIIEKQRSEPALLKYAPAFFNIVKKSLWGTLIETLFKLAVDTRSPGIRSYLQFVESNKNLFLQKQLIENELNNMLREDNARLLKLEPILKCVKGRRNKRWAHYDKDYMPDVEKLNTDFPIKKAIMKKLNQNWETS